MHVFVECHLQDMEIYVVSAWHCYETAGFSGLYQNEPGKQIALSECISVVGHRFYARHKETRHTHRK
jgi:hypothetical protein